MDKDNLKRKVMTELHLPLWPDTGQLIGRGRNSTYEAAARGEIPCVPVGKRNKNVPTAWIRHTLGLKLEGV